MRRYLFFTAVKEVDLPNINRSTGAYQQILVDKIKEAKDEIMSLSDEWIITYNGEDE